MSDCGWLWKLAPLLRELASKWHISGDLENFLKVGCFCLPTLKVYDATYVWQHTAMSIYPYMTTLSPLLLGNVKDKVANVRVITRQYSAHSCQNMTRLTQRLVARSVARQQLRSLSERLGMSKLKRRRRNRNSRQADQLWISWYWWLWLLIQIMILRLQAQPYSFKICMFMKEPSHI